MECLKCCSTDVIKVGIEHLAGGSKQRCRCKTCRHMFLVEIVKEPVKLVVESAVAEKGQEGGAGQEMAEPNEVGFRRRKDFWHRTLREVDYHPMLCDRCSIIALKIYHHSINHQYSLDFDDVVCLCSKCHGVAKNIIRYGLSFREGGLRWEELLTAWVALIDYIAPFVDPSTIRKKGLRRELEGVRKSSAKERQDRFNLASSNGDIHETLEEQEWRLVYPTAKPHWKVCTSCRVAHIVDGNTARRKQYICSDCRGHYEIDDMKIKKEVTGCLI